MASLITAIAEKPEVLILLLFLLAPGFVFIRVVDTLHPGRRQTMGNQIIDVVFWSVAVLAVWFMPALLLFRYGPGLSYGLYPLLLFVLIVLGVFATPLLLAYILHRLELRGTLQSLGTKPSPTPSDWVFSGSADDHYYILFHRKERKDLGGYFGEKSFATSFPHNQEVYIEEEWHLDEDGNFSEPIEGTKGAFVNREDCSLVQFLEVREAALGNQDGHQQNHNGHEDQDGHKPIVEEPYIKPRVRGDGYQSEKPNSPTRRPPGREHN